MSKDTPGPAVAHHMLAFAASYAKRRSRNAEPPTQAQREEALAAAHSGAATALAREQRTVAAREQEIADLTLALAERTAQVGRVCSRVLHLAAKFSSSETC